MLIGISGFAQSGKTTLANMLVKNNGYVRKHIATPLRAMLVPLLEEFGIQYSAQGTQPGEEPNTYDYLEGRLKEEIIPPLGVSGRHLQITLGTEWGRVLIDPNLWVNAWDYPLTEEDDVMNDSVRFPNEEFAIHRKKGVTILIRRPGIGPRAFKWKLFGLGKFLFETFGIWWGVHDSERLDRLDPDYILDNDGTLADFEEKVLLLIAEIHDTTFAQDQNHLDHQLNYQNDAL